MALTQKQKAAIADQARKNIAKRAATQRTKISASEARTVSNKMNKRPGAMKGFTRKDISLLSKNERNTLGATSKANAAKEKFIQKHRSFAKGEGKLAVKNRVLTKSEYKQLGKDIEMRKQLIARAKVARASQAARAANPAPAKATTLTKAVTPVAAKKKTPSPKTKPSTAAIKERTVPNTKTLKKAVPPKARTLKKAVPPKDVRPKKMAATSKLQTLEEAKASAPKPRGPMLGPEKPSTTLSKPASKIASKVSNAKKAAGSTKVGNVVKAVSKTTAAKSVASKASSVAAKVGKNKLVKGAGIAAKVALVAGAAREIQKIGQGKTERDFKRIQVLENRIAVAKGQKPKYKNMGTNSNLVESGKVDVSNALSFVGLGKSRGSRLAELKKMADKTEKNKLNKPAPKPSAGNKSAAVVKGGSTPSATPANKYLVKKGDTLSGIASRSGVSLKDIRDANPKFATQAKYKNGNMIFSGTSVTIPKKKAK